MWWQDLSFGGYYRDDLGRVIVGDGGLNGVELGPAEESTPGWKPVDRFALYTAGSGSDTLTFLYTVQEVHTVRDNSVFEGHRLYMDAVYTSWNGVTNVA